MNAKIPEARRSQRVKSANSDISREPYMLWTNRKAVNQSFFILVSNFMLLPLLYQSPSLSCLAPPYVLLNNHCIDQTRMQIALNSQQFSALVVLHLQLEHNPSISLDARSFLPTACTYSLYVFYVQRNSHIRDGMYSGQPRPRGRHSRGRWNIEQFSDSTKTRPETSQ